MKPQKDLAYQQAIDEHTKHYEWLTEKEYAMFSDMLEKMNTDMMAFEACENDNDDVLQLYLAWKTRDNELLGETLNECLARAIRRYAEDVTPKPRREH